jgi:putative colanic acid biosynthesis acetyltransferase WcaF
VEDGRPSRDLAKFSGVNYDKGRSFWHQALWFCAMNLVFSAWWCPSSFRVALLRAFGARVGHGVLVRHRVRVLWPWKLEIGNNTWVGEGAWLLNLEPIRIGSNVCISQEAFLCTGSHDMRSPTFEYDNGPISVESGAWIGARATVLRGVTIGSGATIAACARVSRNVAPGAIYSSQPHDSRA